MPNAQSRYLVLLVLVGLSAALLPRLSASRVSAEPRWPTDDDTLFSLTDWQAGPASVDAANGNHYISRTLVSASGTMATFVVTTSTDAKTVYRAGADVPFLSSGYTVEAGTAALSSSGAGTRYEVVSASRGAERWLQIDTYGERRGLLGHGPIAWVFATFDGVLGQPNDYYLARVLVRIDDSQPTAARDAAALADVLFPRLATWYRA